MSRSNMRHVRCDVAALAAVLCLAASCEATLLLPSYYASHMVLQHSQPAPLWGLADPGESVVVTVGDQPPLTATASAAGRWNVVIPSQALSASAVSISIKVSGGESTVLEDVLFGQVYICSGQSNMELPVFAALNASSNVAAAGTHGVSLRIMQVAPLPAYYNVSAPQDNLTASIPWSKAAPATVAGMSALCYYYGLQLAEQHPETPVGMIASSWGGTAIEVWMSPGALAKCGASKGEQDTSRASLSFDPGLGHLGVGSGSLSAASCPTKPSTLWNGMMAPLQPLRVQGFLWYQGESNAGAPERYACLFPSMISQWRATWGQAGDIPFIFIQLAPWPNHDVGAIVALRYAQLAALQLPAVGMVVTADIGDPAGCHHPIHPPWKQEVARRAVLVAENLVFNNSAVPLKGPTPVSVTWDAWDPSWGSYHHDSGTQTVCNTNATGFVCGGIRVKFDRSITLGSRYGGSYGMGRGNGFELWNGVIGNTAQGTSNAVSRQLTSPLCIDCRVCPCKQPMEVVGLLADGVTLQLNVTFISGAPRTLKYAFHDYPTMVVYGAADGRPAAPFNATLQYQP